MPVDSAVRAEHPQYGLSGSQQLAAHLSLWHATPISVLQLEQLFLLPILKHCASLVENLFMHPVPPLHHVHVYGEGSAREELVESRNLNGMSLFCFLQPLGELSSGFEHGLW